MKFKKRHLILHADVYSGLNYLPDDSIDCAVTSPPYWGQRNYGFDKQIGVEEHYSEYISKLITIFNLLREKLTKKGVFFLNIGDKYISKYGKSPLGMIPYRLANEMVRQDWLLNDILIWYKPNHMPTSIKNRFANSYEPIFAFSKSKENIFNQKRYSNNNYTNILKVSLQSTPYKHIAAYPEKLIELLLNYVSLNNNSIILDPFSGSGTTLKAVLKKNLANKTIMIERHDEYIDVIIDRCKLNNYYKIKLPFKPYPYKKHSAERQTVLFDKPLDYNIKQQIDKKGFLKVTNNKENFYTLLNLFKNQQLKYHLNNDALCFIGNREFNIKSIISTVSLQEYGWIIRNMIIVTEDNTWFPLFMIVDDNKRVKYRFNYKKLKLRSKTKNTKKWDKADFIGNPVRDILSKNRNKGTIVDIIEYYKNEFPQYVLVGWDDQSITREYVIFNEDEVNDNISIDHNKDGKFLQIKEQKDIIQLNKLKQKIAFFKKNNNKRKNKKNNYKGKYLDIDRYNWGASPGARSSVEAEYFSLKRLYNVNQTLICDYLNYKRRLKGLSKKALTNQFPPDYKHTVGHWLRKDFGGSLPSIEDWDKLDKLLDIEKEVTKYVCKTALKLQTVRNSTYKVPDDFISIKNISQFKKLIG